MLYNVASCWLYLEEYCQIPLAWVSRDPPMLAVAASKLDVYLELCVQFLSS